MARARRAKGKARRAKKTEMPKKLLLVPATLVVVGASVLGINEYTKTSIRDTIASEMNRYEINDFSRDIFTQNDTKYLPIIYKDTDEQITRADIEREFNNRGMRVVSISSEVIGNGTRIETEKATYTVLIYGDVDGDGQVNIFDARKIVEWLLYEKEGTLDANTRRAANVDDENEDAINIFDARRIVEFILGKKSIIDSIPASDISTDKEKPVISLNGEKDVTVRVFDGYNDEGATVTDNLDPNVLVKVSSNVNKDVPGDYVMVYSASDASGNEAEIVTRNVHVVDYVKSIEIAKYPKTEYVNGENITLEGMEAYAIKAYAGKEKTPIDIKDVTFTPTKATLDVKEVKFTYQGYTHTIAVNVVEKAPKITLNGDRNVVLKVGEEYTELGATAIDEIDGEVEVKITGTVNKDVPGTYEIIYTATNSLGKTSTDKRIVEIKDYITEAGVEFEIATGFKTDYVEEDTITFEGVKVFGNYKAAGRKEITSEVKLISDPEKAVYGRDEITISCTVDGVEYSDKATISVVKKFKTMTVSNKIDTADRYKATVIATLAGVADEDKISSDKLEYSVTNSKDGSNISNGYKVEFVDKADGTVDVKFVGDNILENNAKYRITVWSKNDAKKEAKQVFDVETIQYVNKVDIKFENLRTTIVDGREVSGIKAGEVVEADLKLFYTYGEHEVELKDVSLSEINARIYEKGTENEVSNTVASAVVLKDTDKYKIRVTLTETQANTVIIPIDIRISVDGEDIAPFYNTNILKPSSYFLASSTGATGITMSDITLSFDEKASSAGGYDIEPVGLDVYSVFGLVKLDQYGKEKLYRSNISLDDNDKNDSNKVVIRAEANDGTDITRYIKIAAFTKSGSKYSKVPDNDTTTEISHIGISMQNSDYGKELENGRIRIYLGNDEQKSLPINIERKEVEDIIYTDYVENVYGICYKQTTDAIATISSGLHQKDLALSNLENIKFKLSLDGKNEELIDTVKSGRNITYKFKNKDIKDNSGKILETVYDEIIITLPDSSTEVMIKSNLKGSGEYKITPYYKSEGTAISSITMTVAENIEINEVKFENSQNGTEISSVNYGTDDISGLRRVEGITFYHRYTANDIRPVNSVSHKLIKVENSNTKMKVAATYSTGLDISGTEPTDTYVNGISVAVTAKPVDAKFTLKIYRALEDAVANNNNFSFNEEITVTAGHEVTKTGINVGDGKTSYNIYNGDVTLPNTAVDVTNGINVSNFDKNANIVVKADDIYYTLIPINFTYSDGGTTYKSKTLKKSNIVNGQVTDTNKITIYDNVFKASNSSSAGTLAGVKDIIDVKGFTVSEVTESGVKKYRFTAAGESSEQIVDYIGIAVTKSGSIFFGDWKQEYEDNEEIEQADWVKLNSFEVYYKNANIPSTTITINPIGY